MSYEIRLFGVIDKCLDAELGNTAPLGELSPYSLTFSTHKTKIAHANHDGVSARVFDCQRDGVRANLPEGGDVAALSLMDQLVNVLDPTLDFQEQLESLTPDVAATATYRDFVAFAGLLLPGYMEWTQVVNGENVRYKLWMADSIFRTSYDLYEIRVVPPVPNLLDLEDSEQAVREALDNYTVADQINAQEEARGEDSVTRNAALSLRWVDQDTGAVLNLTWMLLVFGPEGLKYEHQIDAIRSYLEDETGRLPDEWVQLIPEIDTSTTLNLLPLWDKVALASAGSVDYVHSPVVDTGVFQDALTRHFGASVPSFVPEDTHYAITYYKSIGFVVFPEPTSTDPYNFLELYPDYAMISVNDVNLNRLSAKTREALKKIEHGIRLAEQDDGLTNLPEGFYRQVEERLTFVCYSVSGITHRVATRATYLAE